MEQSPIGIAITIAAALFLLAAVVWILVMRTRWVWPDGIRHAEYFRGYKAHVIFSAEAAHEFGLDDVEARKAFAKACARAAWSCRNAWREVMSTSAFDPRKRLSAIVVQVLTDEEFDGTDPKGAEIRSGWNGVLGKVGKRVGGDLMPMATMRGKFIDQVKGSGGLVTHELCHRMVLDAPDDGVPAYDYEHTDPRIWIGPGGAESVEYRARELFNRQ